MHKVTHEVKNNTFGVDLEQGYKAKVVYQLENNVMHILLSNFCYGLIESNYITA